LKKSKGGKEDTESEIRSWLAEIAAAESSDNYRAFLDAARRAYRAYGARKSSEHDPIRSSSIFWSSVQTLLPYLFFNLPEPRAKRLDVSAPGPVDKLAAEVSERNLSLQADIQPLKDVIEQAIEQWLVASFGQVWIRYEFEESEDPSGMRSVSHAVAAVDFVHFEDWIMPDCRNWQEVSESWAGRKLYLTREEIEARFPDLEPQDLDQLNYIRGHRDERYTASSRQRSGGVEALERACVYEICDMQRGRRLFLSKDLSTKFLMVAEYTVVEFANGSPFPKPLFGTQTSDSVWSVVDYTYLEDAERTIRETVNTKRLLVKNCKPRAVYASEFEDVLKPVFESLTATGASVKNWASFAQQGGIRGSVDFVPVEQYANCLNILAGVEASEVASFERLSGITDLMKGIADPRNSEGTNRQIGVYGDKRTSRKQQEVARFVRDVQRLQYDVICDAFPAEIIARNANLPLQDPMTAQVLQLLKTESRRAFVIEIETDATIETDERSSRAELTEFMGVLMQVLQVSAQIMQLNPGYVGVVNEILLMSVRSFFSGRKVEETLEQAFEQAKQAQQQQAQQQQQEQQRQQQLEQQQAQQMQQMQQFSMQLQQLQAQLAQRETAINEREVAVKEFQAQANTQLKAQELQVKAQDSQVKTELAMQGAAADTVDAKAKTLLEGERLALREQELQGRKEIEALRAIAKNADYI